MVSRACRVFRSRLSSSEDAKGKTHAPGRHRLGLFGALGLIACVHALPVSADTYKCMDANGRATYTNIQEETKGKSCTVVMREISVVPATPPRPSANTRTPAAFPKVDPATQRSRDDARRKILEDELAAEEKALVQAKAELAQQESIRTGGERNYQRVLDRLQKYKDDVERHEKNVEALKKELSNVK